MAAPASHEITQLLLAWSDGDETAQEKLVPLVYDELRRLARRYMARERGDHTLQTTALVNEAYLRLIHTKDMRWQSRAHFFAVSANVMRRILVDLARERGNLKHGGGARRVSLDEAMVVAPERGADLLALDQALDRLAALSTRQSRVVELRYFGGLNQEEIAEVLKVSLRTVQSDWRLARTWLYRELSRGEENA